MGGCGVSSAYIGVIFDVCMHMHVTKMSHHSGAAAGYIQLAIECCVCVGEREAETEKADVRDKRFPVLLVTPSLFTAFTSLSPLFSLSPVSMSRSISVSSQAGFGFTMASWD